jgi:PhnB protein
VRSGGAELASATCRSVDAPCRPRPAPLPAWRWAGPRCPSWGLGRLQLSDPNDEYGLVAPTGQTEDTVSGSTCIYVADVDAVFDRAVERGATVREKPSTFVTGDRFASIYDPFGHRWAVMTKVEEISPEEAERRLSERASAQG